MKQVRGGHEQGPGGCRVHQSAGEHCALAQGGGGEEGRMHRGPHLFLLSSAPWGCRHLGRSALYCCPPAFNTPDPSTSTTGGSGAGIRAGVGTTLLRKIQLEPVTCAQFSLLPTTEYMGHRWRVRQDTSVPLCAPSTHLHTGRWCLQHHRSCRAWGRGGSHTHRCPQRVPDREHP